MVEKQIQPSARDWLATPQVLNLKNQQEVVEAINAGLREFFMSYVSKPGIKERYTTLKTSDITDSAGVKTTYTDSQGTERGYSFPKDFTLLALEYPMYSRTMHGNPMFTFCIGLARTKHDPQTGGLNRYWNIDTGPSTSLSYTQPWESHLPSASPPYWGDDVTAWCRLHILMPKGHAPVMGLSALQHEKLQLTGETEDEFRTLYKTSNSRWRSHYKKIKDALSGDGPETTEYFAYPNRGLLMPLVGLTLAKRLGITSFQIEKPSESNNEPYIRTYQMLKTNKAGVEVSAVDHLDSP
ncbi:MAG: hypothetical protein KKD39_03025 [Candidatus Altiarchaeota archaeon]|nr:hypothetical protein [Candidatus Altiarchaeota archaeon]